MVPCANAETLMAATAASVKSAFFMLGFCVVPKASELGRVVHAERARPCRRLSDAEIEERFTDVQRWQTGGQPRVIERLKLGRIIALLSRVVVKEFITFTADQSNRIRLRLLRHLARAN